MHIPIILEYAMMMIFCDDGWLDGWMDGWLDEEIL